MDGYFLDRDKLTEMPALFIEKASKITITIDGEEIVAIKFAYYNNVVYLPVLNRLIEIDDKGHMIKDFGCEESYKVYRKDS